MSVFQDHYLCFYYKSIFGCLLILGCKCLSNICHILVTWILGSCCHSSFGNRFVWTRNYKHLRDFILFRTVRTSFWEFALWNFNFCTIKTFKVVYSFILYASYFIFIWIFLKFRLIQNLSTILKLLKCAINLFK